MRNLINLIHELTTAERRYFKLFVRRIQTESSEHRVEELYDLIASNEYTNESEIAAVLYPGNSKNSYYRLKNRLLEDLEKSLLIQHLGKDDRFEIYQYIQLARIYQLKAAYKDSYLLLTKAERIAIKLQKFDILSVIYSELSALALLYDEIDMDYYLDLQKKNQDSYQQHLITQQLMLSLSYRLRKRNFDGNDPELENLIGQLKSNFEIGSSLLESPRIKMQISGVVRRSLLQKKDFEGLEKHLKSHLESAERKKWYSSENHENKILTIVWLINTLVKNGKYKDAIEFTQKLKRELNEHDKLFYQKYIWTYNQSIVVNFFYAGKCEDAIAVLEEIKKQKETKQVSFYNVFVQLNLAVFYYCVDDLIKAFSSLAPLLTKVTYNSLEKPLKLRLSLVELIFHFENGDINFVEHQIEQIRRNFRGLFRQGDYQFEKDFLKIIKKCTKKVKPFKDPSILKSISLFLDSAPKFEPGSNEAISYTIWLNSKIKNENYYNVLLGS